MEPKDSHINHSKDQYYKTNKLKIHFKEIIPYHLDGELFFADSFDVSIQKNALNVIYNPLGKLFFNKFSNYETT